MDIHRLLKNTIRADKDLLKTNFLAPLVKGGKVRTRIHGLVYEFQIIADQSREGWFICKPMNEMIAQVVVEASLSQRARYLSHFPVWRGILIHKENEQSQTWLTFPANADDSKRRFGIKDPTPVFFVEREQRFESIHARFDGSNLWYETIDRRKDPAISKYLRESLREKVAVEELRFPNLTMEDRQSYSILVEEKEIQTKTTIQRKLEGTLGHAQARLLSYIEHPDSFLVTWEAEDQRYETVVRKDDLTVVSAGICLEDRDQDFDLTSIVGVMKEGEGEWYE